MRVTPVFPHQVRAFALLFLFAVIVRLPWFFTDVIDWDESVFILLGQALAEGHLPYTLVWDNKPPLGFLFFAIILKIFPADLAFVRLGGALLVAVAAFLIFRISRNWMSAKDGLLSAFVYIIAASVFIQNAQAVMMEHVALVPLLSSLVLLLRKRPSKVALLSTGLLLGTAVLIRMNLALVAIVIVLAAALLLPLGAVKERILAGLWMSLGGLFALVIVFLPYGLSGHSRLFFKSVFLVPLNHVTYAFSYSEVVQALIAAALPPLVPPLLLSPTDILRLMFWVGGIAGIVLLTKPTSSKTVDGRRLLLATYCVAVIASILASRHPWPHYLIQFAPFAAIGCGAVVSRFDSRADARRIVTLWLLSVSALTLYPAYGRLIHDVSTRQSLYHGRSFELASYMKDVSDSRDTIFLEEDILLYWLLHKYPVHPVAAFPLSIWKEMGVIEPLYGLGTQTETILGQILERTPTHMVLSKHAVGVPFPQGRHSSKFTDIAAFREAISIHYKLEKEYEDRLIFRRK
jgi:4-amino-4-deoxy-L-arabinose transferase-like glycosyltransferase